MSGCDLSIILPVYNDQANLNRILVELTANSPENNFEVIVVDDASSQPLQLIKNAPDHWKICRHETRRGAAFSRNMGVKQAQAEHVVLLSVFLKIPPDYISRVLSFIKDHTFDVAQHLLIKEAGMMTNHFEDFLADQSGRLTQVETNLPIKNTLFTAALFKKEMFSEVGGFDEDMNHYGGHELDFVYRLDKNGYSRRIAIKDIPLERVSLGTHESVRERLREYGRVGLPALLKKHPELKKTILRFPIPWMLLRLLGLPVLMEKRLYDHIEQDWDIPNKKYRLYLHLIVRNAWDAR